MRVRSTFSDQNSKKRQKTTSRKNEEKCIFRNLKIAKMPIYVAPERFSVEPESKQKSNIFLSKVPSFRKTKNRKNQCIHSVLDNVSMPNRHVENVVKKQRLEHPNALKRVYLQHLGTHCFVSKSTTQGKKCYQKATAWAPQKRTLFSIPKSKKRPNAFI